MNATTEANPFIDYFKARWSGASFEDAMTAAGAIKVEPNDEMTGAVREAAIRRLIQGELREAVLDGLLESAKTKTRADTTATCIAQAVRSRIDECLDSRFDLGEDWAGMLFAAERPHTYRRLLGTPEDALATYDALVDALLRTREEYS